LICDSETNNYVEADRLPIVTDLPHTQKSRSIVPLLTSSKFISTPLLRALSCSALYFLATVGSIDDAIADPKGSTELPQMIVFASKNSDNTYTQISEVEWHDGNDVSIVAEKNGSYSPSSTTNSYSLNSLLGSLGRPIVNIDLGYASGSSSMTAEGTLTLKNLLEAFRYLEDGVSLELTPTLAASTGASKVLMQRRLEELLKALSRSSMVNLKIKQVAVQRRADKNHSRSDRWRIQIRRAI
jgi:hypothetical protein